MSCPKTQIILLKGETTMSKKKNQAMKQVKTTSAVKRERDRKAKAEPKPKKVSALDAAAKVLDD